MAKRTKQNSMKRKSGSDDENAPQTRGKWKKKKKADDSDADEPPPSITYYVSIPKLLPPTSSKCGAKIADEDKFIQRGPFTVPTAAPYSTLLNSIATALPCPRGNILESQIVWKPKKPKNAEKLPLGYADGYKVLVAEMEEKAPGSRQVLLFMPTPAKPVEEAPVRDRLLHGVCLIPRLAGSRGTRMMLRRPHLTIPNWSPLARPTPFSSRRYSHSSSRTIVC